MDLSFEFKQVKSELEKIITLLESQKNNKNVKKMYDLADLQEVFKVSRRTLSTWTKEGILPHSKVGNKIWVSEEQLNSFLEKYSNNSNDLKL